MLGDSGRALAAARRVLEVLGQLVARYGPPGYLRSDNGPEFIARRAHAWLGQTGVVTAYIDPGKPWQNGVGESRRHGS
jgi:putative transposase